jgi:chromosome segregation ATPase
MREPCLTEILGSLPGSSTLTRDPVTSERIDQFCENLRVKLTSIDNNMQALKAQIDKRAQTAEQDARAHLDAVKKRMEQDRAKVTAAENDMKKSADERKAATNEKIAQWKAKLEQAKLQSRQTTPNATPPLQRSSQWPRWMQPSRLRSKHG